MNLMLLTLAMCTGEFKTCDPFINFTVVFETDNSVTLLLYQSSVWHCEESSDMENTCLVRHRKFGYVLLED